MFFSSRSIQCTYFLSLSGQFSGRPFTTPHRRHPVVRVCKPRVSARYLHPITPPSFAPRNRIFRATTGASGHGGRGRKQRFAFGSLKLTRGPQNAPQRYNPLASPKYLQCVHPFYSHNAEQYTHMPTLSVSRRSRDMQGTSDGHRPILYLGGIFGGIFFFIRSCHPRFSRISRNGFASTSFPP